MRSPMRALPTCRSVSFNSLQKFRSTRQDECGFDFRFCAVNDVENHVALVQVVHGEALFVKDLHSK